MLFVMLLLALPTAFSAVPSQQSDIAYEKVAHHLELVRNQIELTIENHASLAKDVAKQEREFSGMNIYQRVPTARDDTKDSRALLASLRADLVRSAEKHSGFHLEKIRFMAQWKSSRHSIPLELPFDTDFRLSEEQVVDYRPLEFTIDFDTSTPRDAPAWLRAQQLVIRRLLVPVSWQRRGKRLTGRARIYRYRDFEYPKMLAPDLSHYSTPDAQTAHNVVEQAALRRIRQYRQEIVKMWPSCQPYLDNLRAFARNDARMNFFLKYASLE